MGILLNIHAGIQTVVDVSGHEHMNCISWTNPRSNVLQQQALNEIHFTWIWWQHSAHWLHNSLPCDRETKGVQINIPTITRMPDLRSHVTCLYLRSRFLTPLSIFATCVCSWHSSIIPWYMNWYPPFNNVYTWKCILNAYCAWTHSHILISNLEFQASASDIRMCIFQDACIASACYGEATLSMTSDFLGGFHQGHHLRLKYNAILTEERSMNDYDASHSNSYSA